jgi:glutathione peroxidase
MAKTRTIHDFELATIDGARKELADFRGQVLLVVNVASKCGLTPHYKGLQSLYEEKKGRGFAVLGFPCNQFGGQEPGSEAEVKSFCATTYGVSFPMFSKIDVNGADRAPLYEWLTGEPTQPDGPGDIAWNFTKFLVGRDGTVKARFNPRVEPDDPALRGAIDAALAEP